MLSSIRHDSGDIANPKHSSNNFAISLTIVSLITSFFGILSPNFFHWFLIPVSLCGVIIGTDAVAWIRRQIDFLDPIGLVGMYGFHFFYLAPMLHVYYNLWILGVAPPENWSTWLGGMAILHHIGLLLYRYFRVLAFNYKFPIKYSWRLNNNKFTKS